MDGILEVSKYTMVQIGECTHFVKFNPECALQSTRIVNNPHKPAVAWAQWFIRHPNINFQLFSYQQIEQNKLFYMLHHTFIFILNRNLKSL